MNKLTLPIAILMASNISLFAITPNKNGVYEICNGSQLEEFAALVNSGQNKVNAVLLNDIDMTGVNHTPIANSKGNPFKGSFDGYYHTINNLVMGSASSQNMALFGYVGAGAKISNLVIDKQSSFLGEDHCAAVVAQCCDSEKGWAEFSCLGTSATVKAYSSDSSKGHASGLVGVSDGNVAYRFNNCYNLGAVRGITVGGMSCKAPTAVCKSCFSITDVKVQATSSATAKNPTPVGYIFINGVTDFAENWGYNFFFGTNTVENFYPNIKDSAKQWTDLSKPYQVDNHGVYKVLTSNWADTGQLCWYLNNCSDENTVWGQELSKDLYPNFLPGSPIVTKENGAYKNKSGNVSITITGTVMCGNTPVAGAQVSDGINITYTDSEGHYSINSSNQTGLVYLCNPKGYKYVFKNKEPQFYCHVDNYQPTKVAECNFQLEKDDATDHTVLMIADIQICGRIDDQYIYRDKTIPDINQTIAKHKNKGKDVYIVTLGDQSYNTYWNTKGIGIPETAAFMDGMKPDAIFNCMGNHDNDISIAGDWAASVKYRKQWGPTYYSFNIGEYHYVVLDNILFNNPNCDNTYDIGITNAILDWLKTDLGNVSKDTPVVVCMHAPLFNRPQCNTPNVPNSATYRYTYGAQFANAVKGFKNVYVFTGHAHTCYTETYSNIKEYNVGAPGGNLWWTGYFTENNFVCSDGAAGGYRVVETSGNDMQTFYKSVGFDDEYQFRAYDLNNCHITAARFAPSYKTPADIDTWLANGYGYDSADYNSDGTPKIPNRILINVFGYDKEWKVEVFEEGKPLSVQRISTYDPFSMISDGCQRFEKQGHNSAGNPTLNSHMFMAQASSATTTLTIKVTDENGEIHSRIMQRPKTFSIQEYLPEKENASVINIEADDEISAPTYYDLTGMQVQNPSKGIYIMRFGAKTKKVIF